mgnify:CR=1 FL=1
MACTSWVVHADDAPALIDTPILVTAVELNPDDVTRNGAITARPPVDRNPVVVLVRLVTNTPWTTADVPDPTERKLANTSNVPLSAAAVCAVGNVNVQIAASAVDPFVPMRSVMTAVAVLAAVFVISIEHRYHVPACNRPGATVTTDPFTYVSDVPNVCAAVDPFDGHMMYPATCANVSFFDVPA